MTRSTHFNLDFSAFLTHYERERERERDEEGLLNDKRY